MKRFLLGLAVACALALVSAPLSSQASSSADTQGPKHMLTTLPNGQGRLTLVANSIDKEWAASIVHLKGDVRVELWTAPKNAGNVTVLRADEVDYNEITGKFSPRGNVALTVEEAK